jgi:hypothetical protein
MSEEEYRDVVADYNDVFGTDQGRRVLEHIISNICYLRIPTFTQGQKVDAETSLYVSGRKDVALTIANILNYDFSSPKKKVRR